MSYQRTAILDHGYIELIEPWGSDERIVEAARMSTNKGFQGWGEQQYWKCSDCGFVWRDEPLTEECRLEGGHLNVNGERVGNDGILFCSACTDATAVRYPATTGDEKLLKFLYSHKHMTPFEMAGMTIEVQAPIMVFREWHRHRTQSYNEMSARYTPLPDVNYMPTPERCLVVNAKNKQAGAIKGADELTHESVLAWLDELADVYSHAERVYQSGLKRGIPKELARLCVPVGRYSRMRASANLRNWLAFLSLRMDADAQFEIRQFANALGDEIAQAFPRVWELFNSK